MSRRERFPLGAAVSLSDLEEDLHATLHRLRGVEPVSWLPVTHCWLVTDRDTGIAVMRDPQRFTVDHPGFSTAQVVGPSMLSLDGAEQKRHRQPFEGPFRRRKVLHRFKQPVLDYVEQLIDGFVDNGQAELRRDFAGPVAVRTMITALGMTATPISAVLAWYDAIVDAVTRVTAGEPVSAAGQAAFAHLKAALLPALRLDPDSSLLAAAGGAAGGLSDDEIVANAAVLLFGGIETTEGMITNALYHLLSAPAYIASLLAGDLSYEAVVEESLRLEPAASVIDRYAVNDVQLGEAAIKRDDLVRISLAGANRDPEVFADPDRFDPFRDNLKAHVTFAQGPHVCLGLHLARLEAQLSLQRLVERLPNLSLPHSARNEAKPRGLVFRKPPALTVQWHR